MVCGSPEIPLGLLKSVASYKGVDATSSLVQWFWDVMEEFSNHERSLFLRFVWGRTRLPRTIADFRGRDFVLQVLDKYQPPDHFLPESYTCFFLLKMPRYSCKVWMHEFIESYRLRYQTVCNLLFLSHFFFLKNQISTGRFAGKTKVCHLLLQEHRHRWIRARSDGRSHRTDSQRKWHWIGS